MRTIRKCEVLVVGGGPAGSTAAGFLAREGVQVTLVEREVFPRYHIGESLLPSCLEILTLLGARDAIEKHGFQKKPGAYLEWMGEQWSLDFGELRGNYQYAFQVDRAEFDHLLLKHATSLGAQVLEGTQITELLFDSGRPFAAVCRSRGSDETFEIQFDQLVDASGRAGIMSTRYLRNRQHHSIFKNIAVWGYWSGAQRLEGRQSGAIAVGSIADGWLWAIPLSDGRMSVGAVIHRDAFCAARETAPAEQIYHDAIASCPLLARMTSTATLTSELRVEQDYSYTSDRFTGPGFFLAGDAACFLDPLLSTGVHLAMYSGMLAAASIASLRRAEVTERQATGYYEETYRRAYLRFLVFVAAFYENRGKRGYLSKAEELSRFDSDPNDMKRAFLNLVSGVEDFADAENTTARLMGEMSHRIRENLDLRQDKENFADPSAEVECRIESNARFFDRIEGLTALSPSDAVHGLYVATTPNLGLRPVTGNGLPGLADMPPLLSPAEANYALR